MKTLLSFFLLFHALLIFSQPGTLDTSFGINGIVVFPASSNFSNIYDNKILSDGKIVATGNAFVTARLDEYGRLDSSYNNIGYTERFYPVNCNAFAIDAYSNGDVVVGGYLDSSSVSLYTLMKRRNNGRIDSTFAINGIMKIFFGGSRSSIYDLKIINDNKILTTGYYVQGLNSYIVTAKFNSNGSPDSTFGNNGYILKNLGDASQASCIALQPDGKIIISASHRNTSGAWVYDLLRYSATGIPDSSFGYNGIYTSTSTGYGVSSSIGLQTNGNIVSVISHAFNPFPYKLYSNKPNGRIDSTFNIAGSPISGQTGEYATSLAIEPNDNIILGGRIVANYLEDIAVFRYKQNGIIDSSFGIDGKVKVNILGNEDRAFNVSQYTNSKILVAGKGQESGAPEQATLVRLLNTCVSQPGQPSFNISPGAYCVSDSAIIKISSNNLNSAANWVWYTDTTNVAVYRGDRMKLRLDSAITFFVRAEGVCPNGTFNFINIPAILDTVGPTPNMATLPTIWGACSATINNYPKATDYCLNKQYTATTTSALSYYQQGTYTVIWKYTDDHGNQTTQPQTVIVRDTVAPVYSGILNPIVGNCYVSINIANAPKANDQCSGLITATTSDSLIYYRAGAYTIHWKFIDAFGNTSIVPQQVTVIDTTPPSNIQAGIPNLCNYGISTPYAIDACSGVIDGITNDPTTFSAPGNYTINWAFTDLNGNTANWLQQVEILGDQIGPVFDVNNLVGQCPFTVPIATAFDACDNSIIEGTTTDPLTYSFPDTTVVHWTFTDSNGNESYYNQQVTILGTAQAPTPLVSNLPDIYTSCPINLTPPLAIHRCGTDTIVATTTSNTILTEPANYTVVWTYTNNAAIVTQIQHIYFTDGIDAQITAEGNTLSTGALGSYQWMDCGTGLPINGATDAVFEASTSGNYAVIINQNGCIDTSSCYNVFMTNLNTIEEDEIVLYPNPATTKLFIKIQHGKAQDLKLEIKSTTGQLLYINTFTADQPAELDISSFSAGIYFIRIDYNKGTKTFRLAKK